MIKGHPQETKSKIIINSKIRLFEADEITEINRYLTSVVPYGVLEELYALSDNPVEKSRIFTNMFRIINSAKNYVKKETTREKLTELLNECKYIQAKLGPILLKYGQHTYCRHTYENQIIDIISDYQTSLKINDLIDSFLIFSEKLSFFDADRIAGVESSSREGSNVVDEILEDKSENTG